MGSSTYCDGAMIASVEVIKTGSSVDLERGLEGTALIAFSSSVPAWRSRRFFTPATDPGVSPNI